MLPIAEKDFLAYANYTAAFAHDPGVEIASDDWDEVVKEAKKWVKSSGVEWTEVKILNRDRKVIEHLEYIKDRPRPWRTIK